MRTTSLSNANQNQSYSAALDGVRRRRPIQLVTHYGGVAGWTDPQFLRVDQRSTHHMGDFSFTVEATEVSSPVQTATNA